MDDTLNIRRRYIFFVYYTRRVRSGEEFFFPNLFASVVFRLFIITLFTVNAAEFYVPPPPSHTKTNFHAGNLSPTLSHIRVTIPNARSACPQTNENPKKPPADAIVPCVRHTVHERFTDFVFSVSTPNERQVRERRTFRSYELRRRQRRKSESEKSSDRRTVVLCHPEVMSI